MSNNTRANAGRTPADYEALQFQASVMYIKDGLSADAICKTLNVSMPTISKWCKVGRWKELRPDTDLLNQHKAANLYINEGFTTGKIAQRLNISEIAVNVWVTLFKWDAAKLVNQTKGDHLEIVADFCEYFKKRCPEHSALIATIQNFYNDKILIKTH